MKGKCDIKAPESTFVCCMLSITMSQYFRQELNLEAHIQASSLRVFKGPSKKKPLRQRPLWCWLTLPAARSRDDNLKHTERPSKIAHPAENAGTRTPNRSSTSMRGYPWNGEILHNAKPNHHFIGAGGRPRLSEGYQRSLLPESL